MNHMTSPTSPTFTYTDNTNPLPPVAKLVRAWANRRPYPITWEININSVMAFIDAPSTREHNRAVSSLARILDRAILKNSL